MPPEDVLLMMAQLGVAIAGFNGIASALRSGGRRSRRQEMLGSILVTAAGSVICWSVVPLVLLTTSMTTIRVWQISSLGWAFYQVVILLYRDRQGKKGGLRRSRIYLIFLPMVVAVVVLQAWNGIAGGQAWPHLVGIATSLLLAMTAFFLLVHDREELED